MVYYVKGVTKYIDGVFVTPSIIDIIEKEEKRECNIYTSLNKGIQDAHEAGLTSVTISFKDEEAELADKILPTYRSMGYEIVTEKTEYATFPPKIYEITITISWPLG